MPFPTHWSSCKCSLFLDPPSLERYVAWCAEGEKQPWLCPWTQESHPGKATDLKVIEAVRASFAMTLLIYWPWFLFFLLPSPMPPPWNLYLSKQEQTYPNFSNYPVTPEAEANTSLYQTNLRSKVLRCFIAKKAPNKTNQNQPKSKTPQKTPTKEKKKKNTAV